MGCWGEGRDADASDEHQREAEGDDTGDRHGVLHQLNDRNDLLLPPIISST